jgi:hypothetical protein
MNEAVRPLPLNQAHPAQMRQMKRGGRRRHGQCVADRTGVESRRAGFHKQAKNAQPGLMAERRQHQGSVFYFHISNNIEMKDVAGEVFVKPTRGEARGADGRKLRRRSPASGFR